MDEKQLTIKQTRAVLGWSYPTALEFARTNGEQVTSELWPRPRWFIPYSVINAEVTKREITAADMRATLDELAKNGSS